MLLILFTVGSSTALMVYQAAQQRQSAIRGASAEATLMSRLAAAHEERSIAEVRQLLRGIGANEAVRSRDARATALLFDRLRDRPKAVLGLTALAPDGRVFASTDPGTSGASFARAGWFTGAVASREFAIGELDGLGDAGGRSMRCGFPLYDDRGALLAVLGARLDLGWLRRAAAPARLPEHTSILVVDRAGTVLTQNPPFDRGRADSVIQFPHGATAEWVQRLRGGDGHMHTVAFSPLRAGPGLSLYVGASMNEEAVVAEATDAFWRSFSLLLLVGLLVSGIAWFGVQAAVIRRVEALLAATDHLRAGDLRARTGLPYGHGELSRLARAFDEMATGLQHESVVRANAESQLRASEAYKSAVLESSIDGILVVDSSGRVVECNATSRRLFGCTGGNCVHHCCDELFTDVPLPTVGMAEGPPRLVESVARRMDGTSFPVEIALAPIRNAAGRGLFVATMRDLTERKRWERSIEALTFVDDLTGLYNRRGFSMFASQQLRFAARTGQRVVLVSVDIDGLKAINDTFGHGEGDRAILETAVLLRRCFRESDVIARFGGDEFVVLASEVDVPGTESLLERLAQRIALRNQRGDLPWVLSASFGWTRIDPQLAPPLAELLAVADARMYEAKRALHAGSDPARPGPRPFAVPASVVEGEVALRRAG
jgi:diguanylate cyclase (GGDEF)-like protein